MKIRRAEPAESEALSELAFRSKAHWGYSDEFMAACRDELTLTPEQIASGDVWVAEDPAALEGFYATRKVSPDTQELDALFVAPDRIGTGIGRALMQHALERFGAAPELNRLVIQADPNAAPFYEAAGAVLIGQEPSDSIPGRMLPLYEIDKRTRADTEGESP